MQTTFRVETSIEFKAPFIYGWHGSNKAVELRSCSLEPRLEPLNLPFSGSQSGRALRVAGLRLEALGLLLRLIILEGVPTSSAALSLLAWALAKRRTKRREKRIPGMLNRIIYLRY